MDIDWGTKVITVYQADLTLISGTLYELDTDWFRRQLKDLEDDAVGICFLDTHRHNTPVTVAGTTYARTIEIINGFSVTFDNSPGFYSVRLAGSNNNIFDVQGGILNQNNIQVIPGNAAGLVQVTSGSGLSTEEHDKLMALPGSVWDEVLTGATHNDPTTAGRRLRTLSSTVITEGLAAASTVNTITLNGDALTTDGAYDPALIAIVEGTGAGQSRLIYEYNGTTRVAVVDRDWKTQPDGTSYYIIFAHPGREHVNEGLARGGTINTITLNALASGYDNAYVGQSIFIRSGAGEDQLRHVIAYNGTTKVATVEHDWDVIPTTTSAYVMRPLHTHLIEHVADAVWEYERP